MTQVDWAADLVFDSVGTVLQVRTTDPELGDTISRLMKHFPKTDVEPDRQFSITHRGAEYSVLDSDRVVAEGESRDWALMSLLAAFNKATILGSRSLVVHAGAIARDGHVIAFPASRNAGKSTLVAACLQNGFEYVTDEALFLSSASGRVLGYPKALWLTDDSRALIGLGDDAFGTQLTDSLKSPVLPEELGGRIASGGMDLRHVILVDRDGESPQIEPARPAEIAYELLNHSFNRHQEALRWFREVSSIARAVKSWEFVYGDPVEAARYLDSMLPAIDAGRVT